MYLVFGATGNVGGELVRLLFEQGHGVRALVRSSSRKEQLPSGIDIAVGNLDDAQSLKDSAHDVNGIFFLQVAPEPEQAKKLVDAAEANDVRKVIVMSSLGTRLFPLPMIGARIAERDEVFQHSGLDVTYLHANGLASNAIWWRDAIRNDGRVFDATDPGRTSPVDPFDIARVAAKVLTEDGHAGCGYILSGPDALTAREQVKILSGVLNRPIEFVAVTPEEMKQRNIENGTPSPLAEALRDLHELFRAGRSGVLTDDIRNLTGIGPRTFRDWCERHADQF